MTDSVNGAGQPTAGMAADAVRQGGARSMDSQAARFAAELDKATTKPAADPVYLCERKADLPPPMGLFSHHWIRTSKYEAGMGADCPEPGQGCSDVPYSQTQTIDHTGQWAKPGSICTLQEGVDADCVNERIAPGTPTGRWSLANQCQSFAADVLESCTTGSKVDDQLWDNVAP